VIVIYSKDNCPFCEKAKALCEMKGYEYTTNKIGVDVQMDEFQELFPTARTVPQIVFKNGDRDETVHIGGYTELEQWSASREFIENMSL
jgi:glutaredoxin